MRFNLQEESGRLRQALQKEGQQAGVRLQQMHDMHAAIAERVLAQMCERS